MTVAKPPLRIVHRASALILTAFILVHIANHVAGLEGQAEHIAFMHAVRPFYRNRVVEPLLIALFVVQAATGATLAIRRWRSRRGVIAWAQAISGLYLAAFLLNHIFSVLIGRSMLGLDTDFRFAAAGFHVAGWPWFFAPYYYLAVFALFTHLGCALYWNSRRYGRLLLMGMTGLGAILALGVVVSLAGLLHPVDIPAHYLATYRTG